MVKIVICEDDWIIRKLVERILSDPAYSIFMASNGKEGLELISKVHPDLVICDNEMPVLDGKAVLQALQKHPTWMKIPIILFSAGDPDLQDVKDAGWSDFIAKPFSPAGLRKKIAELTSKLVIRP